MLLWTDDVILFSVIEFYFRVIENHYGDCFPFVMGKIHMLYVFYNKEKASNRKPTDARIGICRSEDKKSQERLKRRKIVGSIYENGRISLNTVLECILLYIPFILPCKASC